MVHIPGESVQSSYEYQGPWIPTVLPPLSTQPVASTVRGTMLPVAAGAPPLPDDVASPPLPPPGPGVELPPEPLGIAPPPPVPPGGASAGLPEESEQAVTARMRRLRVTRSNDWIFMVDLIR